MALLSATPGTRPCSRATSTWRSRPKTRRQPPGDAGAHPTPLDREVRTGAQRRSSGGAPCGPSTIRCAGCAGSARGSHMSRQREGTGERGAHRLARAKDTEGGEGRNGGGGTEGRGGDGVKSSGDPGLGVGTGEAAPPWSAALAPGTPGCWSVVCVNRPGCGPQSLGRTCPGVPAVRLESRELAVRREGGLCRRGRRPTRVAEAK